LTKHDLDQKWGSVDIDIFINLLPEFHTFTIQAGFFFDLVSFRLPFEISPLAAIADRMR
jgi:hypothetical protein